MADSRSDNNSYRFISVHEDAEDEFIVHAGAAWPKEDAGVAHGDLGNGFPSRHVSEQASAAANGVRASDRCVEDAGASCDGVAKKANEVHAKTDRQREMLRHQAEELAKAEENLRDPHAFSRMRHVILAVLAAAVVAFVVYFHLSPALFS